MLGELNEKIRRLKEKVKQEKRLTILRSSAEESLRNEEKRLAQLLERLEKEKADVKKLEGLSLTGLFLTLLGTKEDTVEKERQEFLKVKLQHQECAHSIQGLIEEIDRRTFMIESLGDVQTQYDEALIEKEHYLLETNNAYKQKAFRLSENLADLQSQVKEVDEALEIGYQVRREMADVLLSLRGAQNWGTFDLLGGGTIATAVKHSKLDDAQLKVYSVQRLLNRLQREMADIEMEKIQSINIEIGSFLKFSDFFFDGLIADWMVQNRIKTSSENVEKASNRLGRVISRLEGIRQELTKMIQQIIDERVALLENA